MNIEALKRLLHKDSNKNILQWAYCFFFLNLLIMPRHTNYNSGQGQLILSSRYVGNPVTEPLGNTFMKIYHFLISFCDWLLITAYMRLKWLCRSHWQQFKWNCRYTKGILLPFPKKQRHNLDFLSESGRISVLWCNKLVHKPLLNHIKAKYCITEPQQICLKTIEVKIFGFIIVQLNE